MTVQITRYEQLQRRVGVHMAQALVGPGVVAVWCSLTADWFHHRQQRDHVLVSTFRSESTCCGVGHGGHPRSDGETEKQRQTRTLALVMAGAG